MSAIVFLFGKVLDVDVKIDAVRAQEPERMPVVLSIDEVRRLFQQLPSGANRLIAGLMYGGGLRVSEACKLRVKDVDLDRKQLLIRNGPKQARIASIRPTSS